MPARTSQARWGALRALALAFRTAPGGGRLGARLASLPRLLKAVFTGRYTGTSKSTVGMVLLGLAYIFSPVDIVPEAFLGLLGLGDDAFVLTWIAGTVISETESFLRWEQANPATKRGSVPEHDSRSETVEGSVVG